MSKHSLGPWDVDIESGIVLSAGRQVASVNPIDREANARLIAAAPDMLAALKAMLKRFSHMSDGCIKMSCDAIDKAEG